MSSQRYSPEFKDEAVRQIIERGNSRLPPPEDLQVFLGNSQQGHNLTACAEAGWHGLFLGCGYC